MSPVWVKLGDFGVSKRILADGSTTLHTPVSTQAYSAPEVLGLDSNSETSDYTNSVDIWSLGCVIYELLIGTKLFALEGQVSRYYFGKWPFPEDKLQALSPPTDDVGIYVGLEKPVANWAKHGEADAEEYPVLRRWRKKVSPVAGALRGHSS